MDPWSFLVDVVGWTAVVVFILVAITAIGVAAYAIWKTWRDQK